MKTLRLLFVSACLASSASAASIDFTGFAQAGNLTATPWVGPSTMWGTVDYGNATANAQSGFTSLGSANLSLLTWTFGNLTLTSSFSPGPATPGFENYTPAVTPQPFQVFYNGTLWATGTTFFIYDEVANNSDFTASGNGQFQVTAPGTDPTFFNEVMSLTNGSGLFDANITAFNAVNPSGLFSSVGSINTVPEPAEMATLAAMTALAAVSVRRRRRL